MFLHFFKRIRYVLQKFSRRITDFLLSCTFLEIKTIPQYTAALKYASIYLSRIRKKLAEKSGE